MVIAIIGVLIALLVPAVQKERETANEASAAETLCQVISAQQAFRVELRERNDGLPAMDDWVAGESAAQIMAQVDKTLAPIHS